MKNYTPWLLVIAIFFITNIAEARGFRGEEVGFRDDRNIRFEDQYPRNAYRPEDITNWQHGNNHGYTYNGMHYNYYYKGNYFNYYHNGAYYNYYYKGNYYNYYNNGLYYLYFYNGLYYNDCNNVPRGYPNCP